MKKIVIMMALLAATATFCKAQGPGGGRPQGTPEERAKMQLDRIPATVNLTDDQKSKVTAIYMAQSKSQDSLRTAANGDFQSMMPKMQELSTLSDKKIIAILTPEQKTAYEAYVKERPAGRGFGGGQRPAGAPGQ